LATEGSAEMLALNDPTLLALPHRSGFSGPAWLEIPSPPQRFFEWPDEPGWLGLAQAQLTITFGRFVNAQPTAALLLPSPVQPELALPDLPPMSLAPARSRMWVEGSLAGRKMIAPQPDLPPRAAADILSNTLVRIVVGPDGWPVSAWVRDGGGSGQKAVDDDALALARSLRFEPIAATGPGPEISAAPGSHLTWGILVFEWQTVPLPASDIPAGR
jgi:hypothetical protein